MHIGRSGARVAALFLVPLIFHRVYIHEDAVMIDHQSEVDFNTGDGMVDYVCLDRCQEGRNSFLDLVSGGVKGTSSPSSTVFATSRRGSIVEVIVGIAKWYR